MADTYLSLPIMSTQTLVAQTDGVAAATGKIGELLSASQASNTSTGVGSTGAYGNVTSLAITAGRWLVWGSAAIAPNGGTFSAGVQAGISSSASGVGLGEFDTSLLPLTLTSTDVILNCPSIVLNLASTTTYYVNTKANYSVGAPQHRGKIYALRIG